MKTTKQSQVGETYTPNRMLKGVFDEATSDSPQHVCPSYHELESINESERYTNHDLIGEGSLKNIYECYDEKAKRKVALAKPRKHLEESFYDVFIHEAWITGALTHPNIIKLYDIGVDNDKRPFFTMDLKGNITLSDIIKSKFDPCEALEIFIKVCNAIAYAHSKNIIHLDIKPDNIQCDNYGEVLVCDWGLGKFLSSGEEYSSDLSVEHIAAGHTVYGQIKGSLGYMSPEQLSPNERKTKQCDIYALGCLLYYIMTGEAPFHRDKENLISQAKGADYISVREHYPELNVDESIDAVVRKATQLDPEDRYASASNMSGDISRFLNGYTTKAEKFDVLRELKLFFKRHRTLISTCAFALMILGIMIYFSVNHAKKITTEAEIEKAKINQLSHEYETLEESITQSKASMSAKLTDEGISLRNKFPGLEPISCIKESEILFKRALKLSPTNVLAAAGLADIQCISLNLTELSKYRPDSPTQSTRKKIALARTFPSYSYNDKNRPPLSELIALIDYAITSKLEQQTLIEKMVRYDWYARNDKTGYNTIVEKALKYYNMENSSFDSVYNAQDSTMWIQTNKPLHTKSFKRWEPVLHYLNVNRLSISSTKPFEVSDLDGSSVTTLDLKDASILLPVKPINIIGLKEIIINRHDLDPNQIKKLIISSHSYKITRVSH